MEKKHKISIGYQTSVFPRIQELDDQGVDLLAETWENLTGIDEDEINKFKFALGSWVHSLD